MVDSRKQPLPVAAIVALQDGNLVEAVKQVREANGLGLKEAYDLVRTYVAGHPELQQKFAEAERKKKTGCLLAIAFIVGAFAAGVAFKLYTSH